MSYELYGSKIYVHHKQNTAPTALCMMQHLTGKHYMVLRDYSLGIHLINLEGYTPPCVSNCSAYLTVHLCLKLGRSYQQVSMYIMYMLLSTCTCNVSWQLQDVMTGKHEMGTGAAAEVLSQAIQAAERFPNLTVSPYS